MHAKTLATVLTAVLSTAFITASAFAADADPGYPQAFPSETTRAAVLQDAQVARDHGQLRHGELPLVTNDFDAVKTRPQVHAEALEAIRLGAIPQGEANAVPTAMQLDSIRMAGERALAMNVASR